MIETEQQIINGEQQITERAPWEELNLNGERFLAKKGLVAPVEYEGKQVIFSYDEYHHPETGTEVKVWKLGMDQPKDRPAILRLDYGCPCMELGSKFQLPGHDCAGQRELMFDTVAQLGIGAVATVAEKTAAGNGHGAFAVIEQATQQYEAAQRGEVVPNMEESYAKRGYHPFDNRRHDLVASVVADSVGTERPVILAMSSKTKTMHVKEAGLNILPDTRVELISDQSLSATTALNLRRSTHVDRISTPETGAYLVIGSMHTRLTPPLYDALYPSIGPRTVPILSQRRIVN